MSTRRRKTKQIIPVFFVFFIIATIGLDQFLKILVKNRFVLHESLPIVKNVLHITYVKNTGILFGLLKGYNSILIVISATAILWVSFYAIHFKRDLYKCFCLILIFSGAVGNLIDRFLHGYIIDFIDFRIWPVFNLADTVISIGLILLSINLFKDLFKSKRLKGNKI